MNNWKLLSTKKVDNLAEVLPILLRNRKIEDAKSFLGISKSSIHDPSLMYDMNRAAKIIVKYIKEGKHIYIHGDYDADGIIATSIIWDYLYREHEANIMPFIPSRVENGYGLSDDTIGYLVSKGAELIITVDCGIRDAELVKKWSGRTQFIITDHHSFDSLDFPDNVPVIHANHPKGKYPFAGISGATTVWKLIWAIESLRNNNDSDRIPKKIYKYIDLVSITAITDIMPLIDENRAIVKYGIQKMNNTENPGLSSLMQVSGIERIDKAYQLGYIIGPRINAAGRIGDPIDAVRLFTSRDEKKTLEYATKIDTLNKERQDLTKDAIKFADGNFDLEKNILLVYNPSWHEGIIGLIAGKLSETYGKPSIVLTEGGGNYIKGSARSPSAIDILSIIKSASRLLYKYGGHKNAAGLTLLKANLDEFQALIDDEGEKIKPNKLGHDFKIDFEISPNLVNEELISEISKLRPYGYKNPEPIFLLSGCKILDSREVGSSSKHLKLTIYGEDKIFNGIWFNHSKEDFPTNQSGVVDIIFSPQKNSWNGNEYIDLRIIDVSTPSKS